MKTKNPFIDLLFTHKMSLLLISLILQLIVPVFFAATPIYTLVSHITVSLTVLISVIIFKNSRNSYLFISIIGLATIAILLNAFDIIADGTDTFKIPRIVAILCMYVCIFGYIFKEFKYREDVSLDFIFGAVSGYLIIGFIASFLCIFIEIYNPGSIAFKSLTPIYHDFIYFAFITLTTVGYGDIVATTIQAQTLAISIALFGQLYLAITIAIIVGRYLSENQKTKNTK